MKTILKICLLLLICSAFSSCKKDDISGNADNIPGLGGDVWPPTELDNWLYTNFTQPYNVDVKYKWSQTELSEYNKFVTPVDEAQVMPVMNLIKAVLINPYESVGGPDFMRRYLPRFMILFGSPSYNADGSRTVGQAEGEGRILLFDLNRIKTKDTPGYEPLDSLGVKDLFQIIEHEFGHTLHGNILYPQEFVSITGGYTSNWYNYSAAEANELGFMTPYAMSGPDDDFVETIYFLLVEGQTAFEEVLENIESDTGRLALEQKAATVVNYYRNAWNIDFNALQKQTRAAIESFTK